MDKIYTIGYGRSTWPYFFSRLDVAHIPCVVDIRRECSGSRNGKAFYWGYGQDGERYMGDMLSEAGIEYFTIPELANGYGQSLTTFWTNLEIALECGKGGMSAAYHELKEIMLELGGRNICLLCCERDWKQCHRKIVAEFVAEEMELEIVHL